MNEFLKGLRLPETVKDIFFVDVDQTIAGQNLVLLHVKRYLLLLNSFGLQLTQEEMDKLSSFKKVFDIPSINDFLIENPDIFEKARTIIRSDYSLHASELSAIPDSLKGVWRLQYAADIAGYYTVRPFPGLDSATIEWLSKEEISYPHHKEVVLCENDKDKILKILIKNFPDNNHKILIDDSVKNLLKAASELIIDDPQLREALSSLIIVGFSYTKEQMEEVIDKYPAIKNIIRIEALPDWRIESVDILLQNLSTIKTQK